MPEVIELKSWWPAKSRLISRMFVAVAVLNHARSEDVLLRRDCAIHAAVTLAPVRRLVISALTTRILRERLPAIQLGLQLVTGLWFVGSR
jgi:hypothetical protein